MWFSLSSQVISDPECTGLQRSVCQGDAIADIIPAYHRKIASLETHHDRSEVVRRRELPILVHGDHGVIAGRLGIRGNRVSLVIDRRSVPRWTPWGRFQWDVQTLAQNGPTVQVSDCAPDGPNMLFPAGRPAPPRTAAHCIH